MTIGIAVHGAGAARAALAGLAAVERVGRGAIGGFVSLAALGAGGAVLSAGTQRGGGAALFPDGLPEAVASAHSVVLMSSGPDRPEPLAQFTPADSAAGLMTGHRLPNMPGPDGVAPNVAALAALRAGTAPEAAIRAALDPFPDLDAGLIALDLRGRIALANSASVAARDDIGAALVSDAASGLAVGVLHNSIFPSRALAALAVAAALDSAAPGDGWTRSAPALGLTVAAGPPGRRLVLGPDGAPSGFAAADPVWRGPAWEGSPVRRGDPVVSGDRLVGRVVGEVYCILRDGVVVGARGGGAVTWIETGAEE